MKERVVGEGFWVIFACVIVHALVRGVFSPTWGGEALIPAYWFLSLIVRA